MGQKRAKVISRDAFAKAFVEGEIIMRRNLAGLIQAEIEKAEPEGITYSGDLRTGYINGLKRAQAIVFGEVVES